MLEIHSIKTEASIGVFDSGYGGLTIYKELRTALPEHNFIYLGDNARVPYGTRSYETVLKFTIQGVKALFSMGCPLVIVACNTASAKALRTIQQNYLPIYAPQNRVLGVIRPTTEQIALFTKNGHLGILATEGTVQSNSYLIEANRFFPEIKVSLQACPLWVPLIENQEHNANGADYFVKKYLDLLFLQDPLIDSILLACTHYPLLIPKIREFLADDIQIISQGRLIAKSLGDYLKRHPEIETQLVKMGKEKFYTTENTSRFSENAGLFLDRNISSEPIELG